MRRLLLPVLIALFALISVHARAAVDTSSPFKVVWDAGTTELAQGGKFEFDLSIRMPEGHYLYAEELDLDFASLEGLFVKDIKYPKAVERPDRYLGRMAEVYEGDVKLSIVGEVPAGLHPGLKELTAVLLFRGCSPTICYRQERREITFSVEVVPSLGPDGASPAVRLHPRAPAPLSLSLHERLGLRRLLHEREFSVLLERGVAFTLLIVFLAGVLTSLTPCVWPVLPAIFLFVGVHPHKKFLDNLVTALALVSGLVITYAALGLGAVALGRNLGFLYQQRWFLALVVLFFLVMSLSMFGVFDVRMPRRVHQRLHRMGGDGRRGAFLAGMGLGLVASPCSAPVLAALLGYVALEASYVRGFLLLIVFGIGMGAIMVLLGACYGEIAGKLRGGPWMVWVKRALGIILLFPAAFYMGSLLGWSARVHAPAHRPGIEWMADEAGALAEARRTARPVMIEFTADWCPPCGSLERRFFSRGDIIEMSRRMVALRVDATYETPEVRRLIQKYGVVGWPSVIFLDPSGRPYEDIRTCEYEPSCIEEGMRRALER